MSDKLISTRMKVEELVPGLELARPVGVAGTGGKTLLEQGLTLEQRHINKLHEWGIDEVYVLSDVSHQHQASQQLADDALKMLSDHAKDEAVTGLSASMEMLTGGGEISSDELNEITAQLLEVLSLDKSVLVRTTHTLKDRHFLVRHGVSVAIFSLVLAQAIGMNPDEAQTVGQAALLHDMGLYGMDEALYDHVRLQDGKIVVSDHSHIDRSTELAKRTQAINFEALDAIALHHEFLDGSGPLGKKEDELNKVFRVLSVADMFIHLTQPFDKSLRINETDAVRAIFANKALFDESILRGFLGDFAVYPVGSIVKLSNGTKAVVVSTNKNKPFRPVVKLISNAEDEAFDKQILQDLDRKEHQLVYIKEAMPGEFDFASLL